MADVLTVVAKLRAARQAFRERREREGLIEGAAEVKFHHAITE